MSLYTKEIYDYRTPWNPDEEQFRKYQQREIELAHQHVVIRGINPADTLHSKITVQKALSHQLKA